MEIIGYGEDALTLWAMKNKLDSVLDQLKDKTSPSECKIFYRPSFGRRGGANRSEFGEFDFIILAYDRLYIGESKWDGSSEIKNSIIELRKEQTLRHEIFKCYVRCWFSSDNIIWDQFSLSIKSCFDKKMIKKRVPTRNNKLSQNIVTILNIMKKHYTLQPEVKNVLLFFYKDAKPKQGPKDFQLVTIDYSKDNINNFIKVS